MIELMLFIWIIGVLFSIGLAIGRDRESVISGSEQARIILISLFFWPLTVGIAFSNE